VCGPPPMVEVVTVTLQQLGRSRIMLCLSSDNMADTAVFEPLAALANVHHRMGGPVQPVLCQFGRPMVSLATIPVLFQNAGAGDDNEKLATDTSCF